MPPEQHLYEMIKHGCFICFNRSVFRVLFPSSRLWLKVKFYLFFHRNFIMSVQNVTYPPCHWMTNSSDLRDILESILILDVPVNNCSGCKQAKKKNRLALEKQRKLWRVTNEFINMELPLTFILPTFTTLLIPLAYNNKMGISWFASISHGLRWSISFQLLHKSFIEVYCDNLLGADSAQLGVPSDGKNYFKTLWSFSLSRFCLCC